MKDQDFSEHLDPPQEVCSFIYLAQKIYSNIFIGENVVIIDLSYRGITELTIDIVLMVFFISFSSIITRNGNFLSDAASS